MTGTPLDKLARAHYLTGTISINFYYANLLAEPKTNAFKVMGFINT